MPASTEIVIVNWNAGRLLWNCLNSLAASDDGTVRRVVVVDNGSTDGSADVDFPTLPIEIQRTGKNLGFAKACNLGAADARSPYLLFLNPDCEMPEGGLQTILAFMEQPDSADIAVCGIRLIGEDGIVQRHCAQFPTWRTFVGHTLALSSIFPRVFPPLTMVNCDHLQNCHVDHVIGAFYLIRRKVFEAVGGFDDRFFVYLEDLDLSRRVAGAGWKTFYFAEMTAFHKGGGTSEQVKAHRLFYSLRSRIIYAFKHFSAPQAGIVLLTTVLIEPLTRIARAALRLSPGEFVQTVQAYKMLLLDGANIRRVLKSLD